MILNFDNGMTLKELKEIIKDLPEEDENGEPYEVWITDTSTGWTNVVHEFASLNLTKLGSDILLS